MCMYTYIGKHKYGSVCLAKASSAIIINSLIIIAIVGDICATTPPALVYLLGADGRIHERAHAIIVQAI